MFGGGIQFTDSVTHKLRITGVLTIYLAHQISNNPMDQLTAAVLTCRSIAAAIVYFTNNDDIKRNTLVRDLNCVLHQGKISPVEMIFYHIQVTSKAHNYMHVPEHAPHDLIQEMGIPDKHGRNGIQHLLFPRISPHDC